jgi:hypothetical protein
MKRQLRPVIAALGLVALGVLTACDDLVFDGTRGELTVAAVGSAFQTSVQGTVEFDARVELLADVGQDVVVDSRAGVVSIQPGERTILFRRRVPESRFVRARVVFSRVQAQVDGGLLVGGARRISELRGCAFPSGGYRRGANGRAGAAGQREGHGPDRGPGRTPVARRRSIRRNTVGAHRGLRCRGAHPYGELTRAVPLPGPKVSSG